MLLFKNINIPNFIHSGYYLLDYKHYLRRFQTYSHHTGSDRNKKTKYYCNIREICDV